MLYLGYCLFTAALVAYWAAFINRGLIKGEILSDIGDGIMLSTTVLLLLRLTKKQMEREAEPDKPDDQSCAN